MVYNQQRRKELHDLRVMVRNTFGYEKYVFLLSNATEGVDCYNYDGLYLNTYETCDEAMRFLVTPRHLRDAGKSQLRLVKSQLRLVKDDKGHLSSPTSTNKE